MLILKNCRYIRVAKTGTQYCTHAIKASCKNFREAGILEESYHMSSKDGSSSLPAFGFVRHPITWLESYWRHRCTHGWKEDACEIDLRCQSDKFIEFIEHLLRELRPGFVSRTFQQMLGKNYSDCQFIGRFENLTNDLASALLFFKEDVCIKKLITSPAVNVGNRESFPDQELPQTLAKEIVIAEKELMFQFYADCPILRSALKLS